MIEKYWDMLVCVHFYIFALKSTRAFIGNLPKSFVKSQGTNFSAIQGKFTSRVVPDIRMSFIILYYEREHVFPYQSIDSRLKLFDKAIQRNLLRQNNAEYVLSISVSTLLRLMVFVFSRT